MPTLNFVPIVVKGSKGSNIVPVNPLPPGISRNFTPRQDDRYISFTLEIKSSSTAAAIEKLEALINEKLTTSLSGYFPEMLFFAKDVFDKQKQWKADKKLPQTLYNPKAKYLEAFKEIKQQRYPKLPYTLERLFPGAETNFKNAKKFGLDKFLVLTLPIYLRQFERKTTAARLQPVLYDIAYKLREIKAIKLASPLNIYKRYELLSSQGTGLNEDPTDWMLTNMNATNLPQGINGRHVVIGHPDSGYTTHPQLNFNSTAPNATSPSFDLARDWNVFTDAASAIESRASNAITHFHGTGTSSVIISSPDPQLPVEQRLTGLATGATILPIRTISQADLSGIDTGVVLIGDTDVARAVWYAIQQNVDVISLSVGGYPMPALECVIAHAVYNNTIVVAAAGQYWPFLVFPAAYPECIAVGASNIANQPWFFCVKHPKIAISAPGEKVWCANWNDADRSMPELDGKGNGCSFSTAFVAGAAALWLQRHGRQSLITQLGGRATLQEFFLYHIQTTATVPPNWIPLLSGAGILNVGNLLNRATLPNLVTFYGLSWLDWRRRTEMELLYITYENTDPVVIRERVGALLGTPDLPGLFEQFGQEILNVIAGVEGAVEQIGTAITAAANEAEDAIEDVVDTISSAVSDPLGTIAGWF
jgi:Subtilase family